MQNSVKMDAPRTLVFRPLVKGNEALVTRLNVNVSVGYFFICEINDTRHFHAA